MSPDDKERFLHTELVKSGVGYHQAAKVARILVSRLSDDQLTEEEIRLAKAACKQWLEQRNRLKNLERLFSTSNSGANR